MSVRGGDIRQVKINGREFDPANETNMNLILAGYNSENKATGNGEVEKTIKRKLGGFSDLILSIKDANKDLEFLQDIWDNQDTVPVTITLATGKTYSGSLSGEGELKTETSTGRVTIGMLGKKFEQI